MFALNEIDNRREEKRKAGAQEKTSRHGGID